MQNHIFFGNYILTLILKNSCSDLCIYFFFILIALKHAFLKVTYHKNSVNMDPGYKYRYLRALWFFFYFSAETALN